jgi:hypothetical protein
VPYTPDGHIMQTMPVRQEYDGLPRLQLRDSFSNSFARDTIFSLGKFRIPTDENLCIAELKIYLKPALNVE